MTGDIAQVTRCGSRDTLHYAEMTRILRTVFHLCLLRAGPQDLPASATLFGQALAAYAVAGWIVAVPELGGKNAAWLVLTDIVIIVVLTHFALRVWNFPRRQRQTLTALFGTGALFGFIGWPLIEWRAALGDQIEDIVRPTILLLVLMLWNLAVIGHILRHALSTSLINGILLAILYMIVALTVYQRVFAPAL